MSARALGLVTVANLACDLCQLSPQWHFDSASDRGALLDLWNRGCRRAIARTLEYLRPLRGRPSHPWLAMEAFGTATHAIADFYAHTTWIELYLAKYPSAGIPLAPLFALECDVGQFPPGIQSGYFHLRHGIHGCPRSGDRYHPPPGFQYAHAELAKDFPDKGHGAELIPTGNHSYFDVAVRLATAATVDAWQSLSPLLVDRYGPNASGLLAYF
jgi:hypothetical protein